MRENISERMDEQPEDGAKPSADDRAGHSTERRPETFREYLSRLKREGSALLVTGQTPEWVRRHASRQLFGASRTAESTGQRRRVVVGTDPGFDASAYLPTGTAPSDDNVRVVAVDSTTRAAAGARDATQRADGAEGGSDLAALEGAVRESVAALVSADGEPAPGELRVGVTSLLPLVETHGQDAVVAFCESVGDDVRSHGGMAHAHYPLPDGDRGVQAFRPHVDARIELRQGGADPVECRWHTPYPELNIALDWVQFG